MLRYFEKLSEKNELIQIIKRLDLRDIKAMLKLPQVACTEFFNLLVVREVDSYTEQEMGVL